MTRPKWMRKRKKAMEYLNKFVGYSLRLGYISLQSKSGERNVKINFVNKESGEFDNQKFSTYFGVVVQTVTDVYRNAGKKRYSDKKYKAVIIDDVEDVVNGILWIVYKNWEEYEYEITL